MQYKGTFIGFLLTPLTRTTSFLPPEYSLLWRSCAMRSLSVDTKALFWMSLSAGGTAERYSMSKAVQVTAAQKRAGLGPRRQHCERACVGLIHGTSQLCQVHAELKRLCQPCTSGSLNTSSIPTWVVLELVEDDLPVSHHKALHKSNLRGGRMCQHSALKCRQHSWAAPGKHRGHCCGGYMQLVVVIQGRQPACCSLQPGHAHSFKSVCCQAQQWVQQ